MKFAAGDRARITAAYATTEDDAKYVGREVRVLAVYPHHPFPYQCRVGMTLVTAFLENELEHINEDQS